jgi:hypothetical protein
VVSDEINWKYSSFDDPYYIQAILDSKKDEYFKLTALKRL